MSTNDKAFKDFPHQIEFDLPGFSAMIIKPVDVHIARRRRKK